MTNNENDIDVDVDGDGDFGANTPQKASFKETWENSPALKIGALFLGGVVLIGLYMTFMSSSGDETKAVVQGPDATVVAAAGKAPEDQAYKDAIEAKNKQDLERALQTGDSFVPQTTNQAIDTGIQLPTDTGRKADPLDEWRKRAEEKRLEVENRVLDEDDVPQADVIPIAQPVRPQQTMKQDPDAMKRLAEQMRVIIAAQVPPKNNEGVITERPSLYAVMLEEQKKLEAAQQQAAINDRDSHTTASGASRDSAKVIVAAGSILYAQLLNELNSDVEGPALAQVLSGPFRGGRALGMFEKKEEYLVITFNRLIKDGVVYSVEGIALDEVTTLAAHQTDVDHHYWERVVLPAAAAFVEGYASAVADTGTTTTTTSGGGVTTEQPEPDTKEELLKGAEEAAGVVGEILDEGSKKEVTVIVAKGTTMGILFMNSITTDNASR